MPEESANNPMTRLVPLLTVIALIVMIAGAVFHVATLDGEKAPTFKREDAPVPPVYSETSAWYSRPPAEMPGGWAKPWGVDLLWYADTPAGYRAGWNAPIDWIAADNKPREDDPWLFEASSDFGLYAPKRRYASALNGETQDRVAADALEMEDALKSFQAYADDDNLMRGFFLGGNGSGVTAAFAVYENRVRGVAPYESLFGGYIVEHIFDLPLPLTALPDCLAEETTYPCVINLTNVKDEEKKELVNGVFQKFSLWLDGNIPKPAAPLPPMESLSLSPINKTDQ